MGELFERSMAVILREPAFFLSNLETKLGGVPEVEDIAVQMKLPVYKVEAIKEIVDAVKKLVSKK